jgi:hypothetical protein
MMPAVAAYIGWLAAIRDEAEPWSGPVCRECGSPQLERLLGYYGTGVFGPNGEPEMEWVDAVRCRNCGATEGF